MSAQDWGYSPKGHTDPSQYHSSSSHPNPFFGDGVFSQSTDSVQVTYGDGDPNDFIESPACNKRETNVETVIRLCKKHNIDLDVPQAKKICDTLNAALKTSLFTPLCPIEDHYFAVQLIAHGTRYRVRSYHPAGTGTLGRCADDDDPYGVTAQIEPLESELPNPPQPDNIRSIKMGKGLRLRPRPRVSLSKHFTDNAHKLSKHPFAEFLHIIAHSLGGSEDPSNVVLGSSALNTAMMPLEALALNLSQVASELNYEVGYYPNNNSSENSDEKTDETGVTSQAQPAPDWTNAVVIKISASCGEGVWERSWLISVPDDGKLLHTYYDYMDSRAADAWQSYFDQLWGAAWEDSSG